MTDTEIFETGMKKLLDDTAEYYNKKLPEVTFNFWFNSMKQYDLNSVAKAFAIHMNTPESGRFMPMIADITKILKGTSKDNAFLAWTKVKDSLLSVGAYQSVCFDDPIIHLTIKDLGGWIALCQKTEKELPFIGNEFRSRYEGYRSKGELPIFPKRLAGLHESDNTKNNYLEHVPEPVLVGDRTKSRLLLNGDYQRLLE